MVAQRPYAHLAAGVMASATCLLVTGGAHASLITLSTHSSDSTDPSVLDATMDFNVSGNVLTLTVTNTTSAPFRYRMNELYFNGSDNVLGLTPLALPEDWSFVTDDAADGFGIFDFALIDGVGGSGSAIRPGESLEFTFTIVGTGTDQDFVSDLSDVPPGDMPSIAAAKFFNGPQGDSAFGAFVPAPGASLILLGLLAGSRRRRR